MKPQIGKPRLQTEPPVPMPASKPMTLAETVVLTVKILAWMAAIGGTLWLLTKLASFVDAG